MSRESNHTENGIRMNLPEHKSTQIIQSARWPWLLTAHLAGRKYPVELLFLWDGLFVADCGGIGEPFVNFRHFLRNLCRYNRNLLLGE